MPDIRGTSQHNQNSLLAPVIDPLASAPSSPVEGQQYYSTTSHVMYYWNGTSWIGMDGSGGGAAISEYILLQDQRTSGTDGDMHILGDSWYKCTLNTISNDDTGDITLSSNNFTVPAGSYECTVRSPYAGGGGATTLAVRLRLYNETDSTVVFYGESTSEPDSSEVNAICLISGKFTVLSSKTMSVYMYFPRDGTYNGLSNGGISGVPEIYTQVELRKVA